jgi:hypothetical protein
MFACAALAISVSMKASGPNPALTKFLKVLRDWARTIHFSPKSFFDGCGESLRKQVVESIFSHSYSSGADFVQAESVPLSYVNPAMTGAQV